MPLPSMVAVPDGATDQVTDLSDTLLGSSVAVNCCVWSTVSCTSAGATVTEWTPVGFNSFDASQPPGHAAAIRQAPRRIPSRILRAARARSPDFQISKFPDFQISKLPDVLLNLRHLPRHRLVERRDVRSLELLEAAPRGGQLLLDHREHLHLRVGGLVVDAARFIARALPHAATQPDQVHVDLVGLGEILVVAVDL